MEREVRNMKKRDSKDKERNDECGSTKHRARLTSEQEATIEEMVQAITLESEKTEEDPEYWAGQWRLHWVALDMNRCALVSKMEDKPKDEAKEHEFSVRMSHALEQVEKVFEDMENDLFKFGRDRAGSRKITIRCLPKHWADEVKALSITGLALAVLIEDEGKEREYGDRLFAALSDVSNVFLEVERFTSR